MERHTLHQLTKIIMQFSVTFLVSEDQTECLMYDTVHISDSVLMAKAAATRMPNS